MPRRAGDPILLPADAEANPNKVIRIKADGTDLELAAVSGGTLSNPPSGKYQVTNLYVDPSNGRLTIEYDDTPTP